MTTTMLPPATKNAEAPAGRSRRRPGKKRSLPLTILLWLCALYFLLPLFWLFIASTKDNSDLFSTFGLWFGSRFSLWDNVVSVFTARDGLYLRWALNTVLYAGVSAIGASVVATMAGYAFAKYTFPARGRCSASPSGPS